MGGVGVFGVGSILAEDRALFLMLDKESKLASLLAINNAHTKAKIAKSIVARNAHNRCSCGSVKTNPANSAHTHATTKARRRALPSITRRIPLSGSLDHICPEAGCDTARSFFGNGERVFIQPDPQACICGAKMKPMTTDMSPPIRKSVDNIGIVFSSTD
jgi:hypothetical protein